jgi:hypothetical protein
MNRMLQLLLLRQAIAFTRPMQPVISVLVRITATVCTWMGTN